MPSQGTIDKKFISSISLMDAREINPKIIDQARDNQFVSIIKLIGRFKKTSLAIYHNHVNEDTNLIGVVTGAVTGSGTTSMTVTLTAPSSGVWVAGQQVRINQKAAIVYSVSTGAGQDTLVLKSATGANLTGAAADKVYWQSTAAGEGAAPGTGVRYKTTPYANKIQIIEVYGAPVTDIQSMSRVEIEGDGVWGYQRDQEMILVKKAISGALIGGQGSTTLFSDASPVLVDAAGKPIQTTSGFDEQITTYGGSGLVTTNKVVVAADIDAREDAMLARKAPKDFMVLGGTTAMRPYSTYLKGLASSGIASANLSVDGREVDLKVDKYTSIGGFRYEFVNLETLDDPAIYPTVAGEIAANLYYFPKDAIGLVGGGSEKRFTVRYQENMYLPKSSGPNVKWENLVREQLWGGLAPNPTDGSNVMNSKWTAYMGLELLGVKHFYKEGIIK